jgi:hypothetical protein
VIPGRDGVLVEPGSFDARLTPEARTEWLRSLPDWRRRFWLKLERVFRNGRVIEHRVAMSGGGEWAESEVW